MAEKIVPPQLTPVEKTIFRTVISRARDALSQRPILDDQWSVTLSNELDYDFDALRMPDKEKFTVAIRGRRLDDWCREFVAAHPDAVIIELGCGLDARSSRITLPPSVDWYDVDFAAVMQFRDVLKTPQSSTGTIHALGLDATAVASVDALPRDRPVFVIADGFILFIEIREFRALLDAITDHFPLGDIALNGYTTFAARLLKDLPAMKAIGLVPDQGSAFDDPHTPERWNGHLKLVDRVIISRTPYVARMPLWLRIACHVLNWFPALAAKSDAGVLRYRFEWPERHR